MINYENIAKALNYLQRINYSLKVFHLSNHPSANHEKRRISNFGLDKTVKLFNKEHIECMFTDDQEKKFENLKNYSLFITQKCFIECQYDTNSSIYNKKVEYINAKVEHIIDEIMELCYVIEGLAFEPKECGNN